MPSARQTRNAGLAVSVFVALAAAALAARQGQERRRREPDPTPEDGQHFQRQDRRRGAGALLMAALAVAIAVGSRLPHIAGGRSNPAFVILWLAVFVLILVLLALAFADLWATRAYARRHRAALFREHRRTLRAEWLRPPPGGVEGNEAMPPGNGFPH